MSSRDDLRTLATLKPRAALLWFFVYFTRAAGVRIDTTTKGLCAATGFSERTVYRARRELKASGLPLPGEAR